MLLLEKTKQKTQISGKLAQIETCVLFCEEEQMCARNSETVRMSSINIHNVEHSLTLFKYGKNTVLSPAIRY